ncbi:chromate transporter [Pseudomonas asturiensis]|uniref:Chromate transporter n=2 Tax=Pseudomonas asturiensis TaxID=1190415 RepID=A0A1M7Q3G6_9PSED|nr:chromate transporter [Pseudomonas asturiensis]
MIQVPTSNRRLVMPAEDSRSAWSIFLVFLRLGLTSFGGPVAHLAYFREEFVIRRAWLNDRSYASLVALCQFLPGPASSQVGMALGLSRGGYRGALAAWCGFTLPSAIILTLLALGVTNDHALVPEGILQGLKIVAVAVVAHAVYGMARQHCTTLSKIALALIAASVVLLVPLAWTQIAVIAVAGLVGMLLFRPGLPLNADHLPTPISLEAGAGWLIAFVSLLLGLPLLSTLFPSQTLALIESFYRVGSLVFGGGHVVLPLLQNEVVPSGWVSHETFLVGYGAAQAVPGPLFTFAAYLGASMSVPPTAWTGALIALLAIFAPSFLLVAGALPFWNRLQHNRRIQAACFGINAAVVGVLLAALYRPVWTSAIEGPQDIVLALLALAALLCKVAPWRVVILSAMAGGLLG